MGRERSLLSNMNCRPLETIIETAFFEPKMRGSVILYKKHPPHRIINDRIEKSTYKGKTNWGKGEGFALHFYHGSNVGRTGFALAHPPTTPIPHTRTWGIGVIGGCTRGCGGGGKERSESGVNHPSAKKFFIAAMLLWDEDDVGFILFHSVIYNSVATGYYSTE